MKLLKYSNAKLHNQLIFSIPANLEICGRACPSCYAMKFQRLYPNVLPYRQARYEASLQPDFTDRIIQEITSCKKPLVAVRIHESGEFYSQQYINSWATIASALPHIRFYTFTKRIADFDFTPLSSLSNFTLINSLQSGGLNYGKALDLPPNIYVCPATTSSSRCGIDCSWCWSKCAQHFGVQFVKH